MAVCPACRLGDREGVGRMTRLGYAHEMRVTRTESFYGHRGLLICDNCDHQWWSAHPSAKPFSLVKPPPLYAPARVRQSGLPARFWAKVNKQGGVPEFRPELGHCWVWLGAATGRRADAGGGYGSFRLDGRSRPVHILTYVDTFGSIPRDRPLLDHLCSNRLCCNPHHLDPVTVQVNTLRGLRGAVRRSATHCSRGHELTPENTARSGKGGRDCRTCKAARDRARNRRRAA